MPTPRGGGLAAVAGVGSALLTTRGGLKATVLVPIASLATVGYLDDHKSADGGLPAAGRLGAQVVAGAVMAANPVDRAVAAALTPAVVNVVNFMDGVNGISALTAIVWGASAQGDAQAEVRLLGALTAGAGLGFLPWNAPSARLFLGDAGSYLLGGLMAAGIMEAYTKGGLGSAIRAGAPLIPYAADAAQAIVRRRARGASLTDAHREHVYQVLVDAHRFSHLGSALTHAAAAVLCAVAWHRLPTSAATGVSTLVAGTYLGLPLCLRKGARRQQDTDDLQVTVSPC